MESKGNRCPFLREVQVKSCQASSIRKVIPRAAGAVPEERCSSREYLTCPIAKELHEDHPQMDRCPFLQESLVQYCGAAAVPKYIPYTESMLTRCGTANHAYCEQFLAYAHPKTSSDRTGNGDGPSSSVSGIRFPSHLAYSPNHMWMETNDDGFCHIGIDAFFGSVIGKVGKVSFATEQWDGRPAVVLHACGIDMPMVFPMAFDKLSVHSSVTLHPEWVTEDPYSLGWMFEGRVPGKVPPTDGQGEPESLVTGEKAASLMRKDVDRLIHHFHRRVHRDRPDDLPVMADGGTLRFEEIHKLALEEILYLYNEFFSPSRLGARAT